jgi:serine/threonine-protein kinase
VGLGSDSTFAKGDRVDRFEIDALIAQGGMGAIYRAVDTKLRRMVALKVVRADRLDSSSGDLARQRFLREALAVSKVDHRNVVRVLDFGFVGDTPYLAMEFLRGRDLGQLIKATSGSLPVAEVVDVMLSVCAAIRACHDAGIIHRDLKPSNVFLCDGDDEPEVKILDFGVSKPPIASDLTREGQIVGTPQYLAPEQVDGKAVPQTDQYAIGVMLYACLTKSLPYQNHASLGLLRAIVLGKFPTPRALRPELPVKLEEIILRAMRAAPEERFESVHALGRELLPFGSVHAREKWRLYYRDDRLKAPPKASTHAMPLIEAMARGLSPATPSSDPAGFASTAFAEPIITPRRVTPVSPSVPVATAPAGSGAPAAASGTSGAPAASDAPIASASIAGISGGKRWSVRALIVGGALALAAGGWTLSRRPVGAQPPKIVLPGAPAAPPPAATAEIVTPPRVAAPPANMPSAPVQARTEAPPRPTARAHAGTAHRRKDRRTAPERAADGVPIMP